MRLRGLAAALFASALLGGCFSGVIEIGGGFIPKVYLTPNPQLAETRPTDRLFYSEYVRDSEVTTKLVAVFAEPLRENLAMILDPGHYVSASVGAATLGELSARYTNFRLHAVHEASGRLLGYAFLPKGSRLRPLAVKGGHFILALEDG